MIYDVGDKIDLTVEFRVSGVLTDPTAVVCTLYGPAGTSAPTVTKTGTGLYAATATAAATGRHRVKWAGTGTVIASEWQSFTVRDSAAEAAGTAFVDGLASFQPVS